MSKAALWALSASAIAASMAFAGAAFAGQKGGNGGNHSTPAPTQHTSTTPSKSGGKTFLKYQFKSVAVKSY